MSIKQKLVSTAIALTVAAGALAASMQPSSARSLTRAELAAIAGAGGFVLGATIAGSRRAPDYHGYHGYHRSGWESHVDRCYARYRSYDAASDTYVGYDGYRRYCRL